MKIRITRDDGSEISGGMLSIPLFLGNIVVVAHDFSDDDLCMISDYLHGQLHSNSVVIRSCYPTQRKPSFPIRDIRALTYNELSAFHRAVHAHMRDPSAECQHKAEQERAACISSEAHQKHRRNWLKKHPLTLMNGANIIRLAAKTGCDPKTVRFVYRGGRTRPATRRKIVRAAHKLGLVQPPPEE